MPQIVQNLHDANLHSFTTPSSDAILNNYFNLSVDRKNNGR